MKIILIALISFFVAGCASNKAMLISTAENKSPENLCADSYYRTCTQSGTYNECLSEVHSYVSPCSLKSFPKNRASYSKPEFLAYNRNFSSCLLAMHISDRSSEGKLEANPMCEERGFYTIHDKNK